MHAAIGSPIFIDLKMNNTIGCFEDSQFALTFRRKKLKKLKKVKIFVLKDVVPIGCTFSIF